MQYFDSNMEQSDFSLLKTECEGNLLFLYSKGSSSRNEVDSSDEVGIFCKIDLRSQRQRSHLMNTTSNLVTSEVNLQLRSNVVRPAEAILEDKVLPDSSMHIFPRESVLNGMVVE